MKRLYTKQNHTECKSQLIILPFIENAKNIAFTAFNSQFEQLLSQTAAHHQFTGKIGEILTVLPKPEQTLIVAGLGKRPSANTWRDAIAKSITIAINKKIKTVSIFLDTLMESHISYCVEGVTFGVYRFHKYKTNPVPICVSQVKVGVIARAASHAVGTKMVRRATIRADAVCRCRDLVNEPANRLGVTEFISLTQKTAKASSLQCKVISGTTLTQKGFGLINAVGQGSNQSPALLELKYVPSKIKPHGSRTIALIGKGVVFDSGGLDLKPAEYMTNMKTDMAGAAVVLSVVAALADLNSPHHVTAYIPLAENAIGKNAMRPGDIFTSYSGRTVEITNTDAEGRLLLADTLAYTENRNFNEIIDFATLTGASSIALGRKRGAVFSSNKPLLGKWMDIAEKNGEYIWPLPLATELESELRSDVADLKNSGGRFGGTISAALFLQKFTSSANWVHFDIAGPARATTSSFACPKGGTGFMVLTALEYLEK
ncbi:MAG: leucyl aminopeptidase [Deltaproteobacteria bacterium]|nr:leucyl aminopeptidase [Deltaproteobacteria bacterium]MBN2672160.1 leucyl aminopeptidase [Deltaproteobacteria bacterium]